MPHIEYFDQADRVCGFSSYFTRAYNHNNVGEEAEDTLVIYPGENVTFIPTGEPLSYDTDPSVSGMFFDLRRAGRRGGGIMLCVSGRPIVVNGREVGIYNPVRHLLVASDWTHDAGCLNALYEIWPKVVKDLGLVKK